MNDHIHTMFIIYICYNLYLNESGFDGGGVLTLYNILASAAQNFITNVHNQICKIH